MQRYGRTRKAVKQDKVGEYDEIVKHGARLGAEKAFSRPAYQSIDAVEYYSRKGITLDGEVNTD